MTAYEPCISYPLYNHEIGTKRSSDEENTTEFTQMKLRRNNVCTRECCENCFVI